MTTTTQPITIEAWPVAPERAETNKERILRALREAEDNGIKQIVHSLSDGENGRCAFGVIIDALGSSWFLDYGFDPARTFSDGSILTWNNDHRLPFAEIADRLEHRPEFWNEHADEPFTPVATGSETDGR